MNNRSKIGHTIKQWTRFPCQKILGFQNFRKMFSFNLNNYEILFRVGWAWNRKVQTQHLMCLSSRHFQIKYNLINFKRLLLMKFHFSVLRIWYYKINYNLKLLRLELILVKFMTINHLLIFSIYHFQHIGLHMKFMNNKINLKKEKLKLIA